VLESNRDLVLRRLVECLGRDRTRHQVAEVTSLGLVQMTRKRIGTGLLEAFSETCDHCQGRGLIIHDLPIEPRRGGGDDESRRSGRRRRGKGGAQVEDTAPKPVPSPKDVAAMAKPPAEQDEDTKPEPEEPPADTAQPTPEESAPEAEVEGQAAEAEEQVVTEPPAPEPVVEKPVTKVVTRSRRRAASRPAGPPATAEEPEQPEQAEQPEPPEQPEQPPADEDPVVGAIGAPAEHGVVEPNVGELEPGVVPDPEPVVEEPHVEHVPIKKKGTRKR
jgi:ribonuclease E